LWQWLARVSDPADLALPGKKKPEKKTDEDAPVSAAEPAEPTVEAEADPFEHEGEETVEETLVVVSGEEVDRLKEDFDFEGETPRKPSPDQAEEAAETRRAEPEDELVIRDEDEDLFEASSIHDDLDLLMRIEQSRYQKECFLKFGFEEIDARLQLENVYTYLKVRGWDNNALTKARKREGLEETFIDVQAENHCDFCGMPLTGVSYERLGDGRTRCNDCASSAINQVSEFRELFRRTELMMGATYSIKLPVTIAVRVADARTIARHSGMVFRPSVQQTARVLGFAQRKHGKYSLFIENGSPRLAAIDTTTHELTHIWQYLNWKDADIRRIYAQSKPAYTRLARDIVYEGMAVWASIQMLYAMGETYYARQQETIAERREDVYGIGFILYRDRYGMVRNGEAPVFTPFADFPPIDPAELKKLFEEDE